VTTNKGTLIAVCDARIERWNDAPNNIDLAMKRSFDMGKTWTPLKIIADYPEKKPQVMLHCWLTGRREQYGCFSIILFPMRDLNLKC